MTSRGAAEITTNVNRQSSTPVEEIDERPDIAAQANAAPGLDQMLPPHAAELGVVANQVGELTTLLDQVASSQPVDLPLKIGRANQLTEHHARIVETQRLVEIRRDEEMPRRGNL